MPRLINTLRAVTGGKCFLHIPQVPSIPVEKCGNLSAQRPSWKRRKLLFNLKMLSETVPESSMPENAAAIMQAGKKSWQQLAIHVMVKFDIDERLHWWNELCSNMSIGI